MSKGSIEAVLTAIAGGATQPVYLIAGDLVLAEPAAVRVAETLAKRSGCEVERHRRPESLLPILDDLRTMSMFQPAKVALVLDSALFVDRRGAADLIDQAEEGLPIEAGAELSGAQRRAASRLLQALRVFGVDAATADAGSLEELPSWAFQGGQKLRKRKTRGRAAKAQKVLREGLVVLLEAAREAGLVGFAEGDLAVLGSVVETGLPDGHALVLVERAAAKDHPLVASLTKAGVVVELGGVEVDRRGTFQGLDRLATQLGEETGVGIASDAVRELARRTLRQEKDWRSKGIDANSTSRFAAEYRKLAALVGSGRIQLSHIGSAVEDRGDEDVWAILGALGEGRGDESLDRFRRYLAGADDLMAARLSFFALLASFCRQLSAVAGLMRVNQVPPGERNYNRFKQRWVGALQGALPDGGTNPVASLHPFRLHKAYMAASRLSPKAATRLPAAVLETEMRIKGDSRQADAAIAALIVGLSASLAAR